MPGPPLRTLVADHARRRPASTWLPRMPATAASWLSKTRAVPVKVRMPHPRPRSSRCSLRARDCRTAPRGRHPCEKACSAERITPVARSSVEILPAARLAEGDLRRHAAGRRAEEACAPPRCCVRVMSQRPSASPRVGACTVGRLGVDQAGAVELAQDRHDPAGAMDVLHVDVGTWPAPPCTDTAPGATAGRCRPW